MSAERASRLARTLTKISGLALCLLLGIALAGARVTSPSSSSGVTCSGCSANVIPVSDGTNLIDSGLTYHANAGVFPTVPDTLDIGRIQGSRFRHLHISGTLHATVVSLDTLTPRSGNVTVSSGSLVTITVAGGSTGSLDFAGNTTARMRLYDTLGLRLGTTTLGFGSGIGAQDIVFNRTAAQTLRLDSDGSGTALTAFNVIGNIHSTATIHAQSAMVYGAHVVTIASNGVASVENAEILTGARSLLFVDCLDADGCTLHIGNSGLTPGQMVQIVSISANGTLLVPSVTTGSNIQHLASAFTMGVNDTLSLIFARNRSGASYLLELGRSNN